MPQRSQVLAFLLGLSLAVVGISFAAPQKPARTFEQLDVFAEALALVESRYVDRVPPKKLVQAAVKGMVTSLDPHSDYLTPEEYADLHGMTEGEFGGIGVEVDLLPEEGGGILEITTVQPGTPAARAGLQVGDRIVAVDGRRGPPEDLSSRLRGRPGSPVEISLDRTGQPVRPVTLVRERIQVSAVKAELIAPGYGYIRIAQFQDRVDQETLAALSRLAQSSAGGLRGLVLDLRGNPGGLVDQAVAVADLFVASGVLVTSVGRDGKKLDEPRGRESGTWSGFPIVCLVNGQSASASEILAGALQDHRRAVILGTRTYGKGSVQTLLDLRDGGGLKLTTARYLTPSGRSLQAQGIVPDMLVEQYDPQAMAEARIEDAGQREADLAGHLAAGAAVGETLRPEIAIWLNTDHQLSTGYQALRGLARVLQPPSQ